MATQFKAPIFPAYAAQGSKMAWQERHVINERAATLPHYHVRPPAAHLSPRRRRRVRGARAHRQAHARAT